MNKTESSRYVEDVSGIIVGGDHIVGQCYYEDRPQGPLLYGSNDAEIIQKAREYSAQLKAQYGPEYARLYPLGLTVRIFD